MASNASAVPQVNSNTVKIIGSVGVGLKLLPTFVAGIETLFGKKTGATKKDAVTALVNASIFGSAFGLNLAGSPEYSEVLTALAPAIDQNIDAVAEQFFPPKPEPTPTTPANQVASTVTFTTSAPVTTSPVTVSASVESSQDTVLQNAG